MDVLIFCLEAPAYGVTIAARQLTFESELGIFSMPCPMADDWFQKVSYAPTSAPIVVRFVGPVAVVLLHSQENAIRFEEWLEQANREVEHGFATMRG